MKKTIRMISKSYYNDPVINTSPSGYTCYAGALQGALDEYNFIDEPKKILSITDNQTTKYTEMNITDVIGGMAILLYEVEE